MRQISSVINLPCPTHFPLKEWTFVRSRWRRKKLEEKKAEKLRMEGERKQCDRMGMVGERELL